MGVLSRAGRRLRVQVLSSGLLYVRPLCFLPLDCQTEEALLNGRCELFLQLDPTRSSITGIAVIVM